MGGKIGFLYVGFGLSLLFLLPAPAAARTPVAIVEEIAAPGTSLQVMDYLYGGTTIALGQRGKIAIAYFRSCVVEEITGGTVVVGLRKSRIRDEGKVKRRTVACAGSNLLLTVRQADQAAGFVLRVPQEKPREITLTVYSTSPIFVLTRPTQEIVIRRVDSKIQEVHRLKVSGSRLDLAPSTIRLEPGATYVASTASATVRFHIAGDAIEKTRFLIRRIVGL